MTRRHAPDIARFEVHQVHLIERIFALAFALKNHHGSVSGEIPLSGAHTIEGQLTRIRNEIGERR